MFTAILNAIKALVSRIPWSKVPQFLSWAYSVASAAIKYAGAHLSKILSFIKNNPGKIVSWFLNGWSAYDIIKQILAYFGINI